MATGVWFESASTEIGGSDLDAAGLSALSPELLEGEVFVLCESLTAVAISVLASDVPGAFNAVPPDGRSPEEP